MNKLKLFLIVISPLFISIALATPYIIKGYKNYKSKIEYNSLEKKEEKLNEKIEELSKIKANDENKLLFLSNEKLTKESLEQEYNKVEKELNTINKSIKDYDNKISNQKKSNDNISKYIQ